jgi:hypothetical protein
MSLGPVNRYHSTTQRRARHETPARPLGDLAHNMSWLHRTRLQGGSCVARKLRVGIAHTAMLFSSTLSDHLKSLSVRRLRFLERVTRRFRDRTPRRHQGKPKRRQVAALQRCRRSESTVPGLAARWVVSLASCRRQPMVSVFCEHPSMPATSHRAPRQSPRDRLAVHIIGPATTLSFASVGSFNQTRHGVAPHPAGLLRDPNLASWQ